MKKKLCALMLASTLYMNPLLVAHCQMPCGIYHDDMVFNQIDQYVETMFKGMSVLTENKFSTVKERNEFVRWVIQKEDASDQISELFLKYFLQQKIKPGEEDTPEKLKSVHKLLFMIVAIKQNTDTKLVMDFGEEWEHFKDFFHPEGYECQVELLKCTKKKQELKEKIKGGKVDEEDHEKMHEMGIEHHHD